MSDMITWPEPEKGLRLVVCLLIMWGMWMRAGGKTKIDYPGFTMEYRMMREGAGAAQAGKRAPELHRCIVSEILDKLIAAMPTRQRKILVARYAWEMKDYQIRQMLRCGQDRLDQESNQAESDLELIVEDLAA